MLRLLCGFALLLLLQSLAPSARAADAAQWRDRTIYQVLTDRFANPRSSAGCDDLGDYCGGTWAGLTAKLDYIQTLGFDAVWISPVVENTPRGYHGYWAKNLSAVNPFFGDKDDLKALVRAAHAKGIWVMVDVVGNHMGGSIGDVGGFAPFNQQEHYHDCQGCGGGCDITDFSTLYSENCEHCRLAGLPDLNQDNAYVAQQLNAWIGALVKEFDFDGVRVDTVPEVKPAFWKSFNAAAGTFAVGEVFNGDIDYVSPFQGAALDGVLSYPMYFQLRNVYASQQPFAELQTLSDAMPDKFSDTSVLGSFVGNHDNPRFLNARGDRAAYRNALLHMLFNPGIPIVYYGSEQGFFGGSDPNCREIMWTSEYDTSNDLYTFLKAAIAARKSTAAWNLPYPKYWYADDTFGLFSRGPGVLVATTNVGGNSGDVSQTVFLGGTVSDGTQFCDALGSGACVTVSGGQIAVTLSGGEPQLLVMQ
jgi:alpha-amylase